MKVAHFKMDGGQDADQRPELTAPNVWTSVSNFDFGPMGTQSRLSTAHRVDGMEATWTTPTICEPVHAMSVDLPITSGSRATTNYRWYFGGPYGGGNPRIAMQLAGVDSNVTPGGYGAAAAGRYTSGVLNNLVPFINPQTKPPYYWDYLGAAWTILPNIRAAGSTYNAMRSHKGYLIGIGYMDTATLPETDTVHWSVASPYNAPPTTWVPAATNDAGDAILPGGGECVDGDELGQDFIIYKKDRSYRMTFVGGNYVFAFRPLFKGWGCYSQNCIQTLGGMQYVFTGTDLVQHDGQRWESMLNGKYRGDFTSATLGASAANTYLALDKANKQLLLCLTQSGFARPGAAITVCLNTGAVGYRGFSPRLSFIVEGQADGTLIGAYPGTGVASSGRFMNLHDTGGQFNGTNITATIAKEKFNFGDPSTVKTIKWVRPWLRGTAADVITVEVAGTMLPDTAVSYSSAPSYTIGTTEKCDVHAYGRFFSFRFGSATDIAKWDITGFTVGYEETSGPAY